MLSAVSVLPAIGRAKNDLLAAVAANKGDPGALAQAVTDIPRGYPGAASRPVPVTTQLRATRADVLAGIAAAQPNLAPLATHSDVSAVLTKLAVADMAMRVRQSDSGKGELTADLMQDAFLPGNSLYAASHPSGQSAAALCQPPLLASSAPRCCASSRRRFRSRATRRTTPSPMLSRTMRTPPVTAWPGATRPARTSTTSAPQLRIRGHRPTGHAHERRDQARLHVISVTRPRPQRSSASPTGAAGPSLKRRS